MKKGPAFYEGKAKILYATDSPEYVIQYFKDDATAFNAAKKGTVLSKGIYNNQISTRIFEYLQQQNIPTHFVERLNDREMLVKRVEIVPIEVIIRNRAAGSLCRLVGIEEGAVLSRSILEFCYKNDEFGDPLINEDHIAVMNLATETEVKTIKSLTFRVNDALSKLFMPMKIELIDFKLEFGRLDGEIVLADEISPDTCRLWELGTGRRLDKDRFRHDMGNIGEAYQEVLKKLTSEPVRD
jgi:phosphoribosylaminoimidazole-succinocarboxamide synthase